MNTKIQLSVIIPVYNVEAYIGKCLDSVIQQTGVNFEIICINDGSPDNSKAIIQQYIDYHPYVRCIDQENAGLSAARNTGIRAAKGEYIVLLDSDDWLEEGALKVLYQQAHKEDVDILIGNTKIIYSDRVHIESINALSLIDTCRSGQEALFELMKSEVYVPMAYNYIYKLDFILKNNLFFEDGLIYEDELWTPHVFLKANRVSANSLYHYNYLQRNNTITNSSGNRKKRDSMFYISEELIKMAKLENHHLLSELLWIRACILYYRGKVMEKSLKLDATYKISWIDIMKGNLSELAFEKCLGFLFYSKQKRRIIRVIRKLQICQFK